MYFQFLCCVLLWLQTVAVLDVKEGDVCLTPDHEMGTCVLFTDCSVIFMKGVEFFQKSKCGGSTTLVCCGGQVHQNSAVSTPKEDKILLSDFSDESLCGLEAASNRIKGGTLAGFEEFPWLAALECKSRLTHKIAGIKCGGSLISDLYILTAAHCVWNIEFEVVRAWLGATSIGSQGNCLNFTGKPECVDSIIKMNVRHTIGHPKYDSQEHRNDIALLRLEHRIKFTNYIRPICLTSPDLPLAKIGTYLSVAGWGTTENRDLSDIKLKVKVPVANDSLCNEALDESDYIIPSEQICAGGEPGRDACQGDSGGPLMKDFRNVDGDSQWYQEGVVSYGVGCGVEGRGAVYGRVSAYVEWITSRITALEINLEIGDSCTTPSGNPGMCIILHKCPEVFKAVLTKNSSANEFAQKSYCGYDNETLVCCESSGHAVPPNLETEALPNTTVCGVVREPKIKDGEIVETGEFPWTVGIEYQSKRNDKYAGIRCAGSLINHRYVLSLAYCIAHGEYEPTAIWLGNWNITVTGSKCNKTDVDCADPDRRVPIKQIIPHPLYNHYYYHNDIGLLLLETKIQFTDHISPVCLPFVNLPPPEHLTRLVAAGWRKTTTDGPTDVLLKAEVPLISNEQCMKKINEFFKIVIRPQYLCAGGEGDKNSCRINAGGPLMRIYEEKPNGTMRWYQDGVISEGVGCGDEGFPAVHVRVSSYMDWITSIISEE